MIKIKYTSSYTSPNTSISYSNKNVLDDIGRFLKVKSQLLVGGSSVEKDKKLLIENTPQVVIGTPGRVHDMFRRRYLSNKHLKLLVLDEADEMLSSGFKEQKYKIFQFMPNDIQIG